MAPSSRHGPIAAPATALIRMALIFMALSANAQAAGSLYARMGGQPTIDAIVSDTIDRVVADHRLKRSFDGSNIARIKQKLGEQICSLAGGGCEYTGDPMREVHAGHHISEAEFYGMVEILRVSMREHHIGLHERNEMLALLAPMERDVVEPPASLKKARN
jgi:hemoglobin